MICDVRLLAVLVSTLVGSSSVATSAARDVMPNASALLSSKKGSPEDAQELPDLLATLVQTHTDERVALDAVSPSAERFDSLLADRVTGQRHTVDPRLLAVLRQLAANHPGARIEIVSGYRSEKLNEMLRKKGHHVATHSQHSLGHAVDFRVETPSGALGPFDTERELRALGWDGGIGVYLSAGDRFTHADVGPNRRWNGL
jgi:uncharacterized protein YcbK (DUF882 family)